MEQHPANDSATHWSFYQDKRPAVARVRPIGPPAAKVVFDPMADSEAFLKMDCTLGTAKPSKRVCVNAAGYDEFRVTPSGFWTIP
jgi:hypothetical protein